MKIGTKSLLFGAHQFILHPVFVAIAWCKLFGFPKDIRIWIAFIVHDWGYWGKPNMDGKEGEEHPIVGAEIMHKLFDKKAKVVDIGRGRSIYSSATSDWYDFTLFHSRFYAAVRGAKISKLCVADKYAFGVPPSWLYIMLASWSGEIKEYMTKGRSKYIWENKKDWYWHIYVTMIKWVNENKKEFIK